MYQNNKAEQGGAYSCNKNNRVNRQSQYSGGKISLPHLYGVKVKLPGQKTKCHQEENIHNTIDNILSPLPESGKQQVYRYVAPLELTMGYGEEDHNNQHKLAEFKSASYRSVKDTSSHDVANSD